MGGRSDAELREAVIAGWHRLEAEVRSNADRLGGLVALTGIPFRKLDLVRRVRNQIAHPDEPVPRERLLSALRIIADAELRLAARQQKPKKRPANKTAGRRSGQATPRRPARREPARRGGAKRPEPRRPRRRGAPNKRTRAGAVTIAVVVLLAAAIAVAILLLPG
jgi:hypothetical protein